MWDSGQELIESIMVIHKGWGIPTRGLNILIKDETCRFLDQNIHPRGCDFLVPHGKYDVTIEFLLWRQGEWGWDRLFSNNRQCGIAFCSERQQCWINRSRTTFDVTIKILLWRHIFSLKLIQIFYENTLISWFSKSSKK